MVAGTRSCSHSARLAIRLLRVAARLKLSPDQYASSPQLRAWMEKNWRQKFVPENLLKLWRLKDWGPADDRPAHAQYRRCKPLGSLFD